MNLPRCECGQYHAPAARYCEWCGAQPPRPKGTGRQEAAPMTEAEATVFVQGVIALNEALETTGGKWGVA